MRRRRILSHEVQYHLEGISPVPPETNIIEKHHICLQANVVLFMEGKRKKIPAPNADTPPAFEQSEAGRRRKRKRTPFSGVLAARTETAETERQVVLLMWCA